MTIHTQIHGGDPDGSEYTGVTIYNNQVFGKQIFLFKIASITAHKYVGLFLQRTNNDGHIADVSDMFIIPNAIINESTLTSHTAYTTTNNDFPFTFYTMPYSDTNETFITEISKVTSFTGLTIKNNKCFVYPYNYLLVTNNNGNNNIYKYENFSTTNCVFENQLAMSIGISGRLVPKNYKGMSYCDDEALPLGKYPTCGWTADSYTNWLTQNAINIPTNLALSVVGIGTNINNTNTEIQKAIEKGKNIAPLATQAGLSIGTSLAGAIANTIGEFRSASLAPNISGGGNTGNVIFSSNKNCFTFRQMRVKNEWLKIIDDYFTKFGYKTNRIKIPNITGRTYWNYIEIDPSDEIGYGDVPAVYMEEINNACRRGVTIWHSHSNIGDYSLNNAIVTTI